MQRIVIHIHKLLLKKNKTVAVAESCTGGLTSAFLTRLSGSSKFFVLGIVAYSNPAKEEVLKVAHKVIMESGAVSKKVAVAMAESVRKMAQTDFGIAITGIAGPTGGTFSKPVGTVFIAIDRKNKKICKRFFFKGSRNTVREKTSLKALELLIRILKHKI